ncbi:(d)CMP kinase [Aerococcus urinaeequi]|uniref:(d)CMP kinase n=1 Tax=Aerococcus sp. HMSC10H05 TaxID=1581084 RepID=UPI0008A5122A|nr:(d)CMP kinase [Aerococcus sp. HMSC10H05]OFU48346.1 cytidylate kinase [Aerococcus sp. HMSC10H05]
MSKAIQVAIDGPASSGKSTIAKKIAKKLAYVYLDTGAMYRAITLLALENNIAAEDVEKLKVLAEASEITFEPTKDGQRVLVNGLDQSAEIRTDRISKQVSKYAAVSEVRQVLVEKQRAYTQNGQGVVMDGRDIGTVVLPDAEVKIFLTASAEERGRRRFLENQEKGYSDMNLVDLIEDIKRRDLYDTTREDSPLVPADNAVMLDSSGLTIEEVEDKILAEIQQAIA